VSPHGFFIHVATKMFLGPKKIECSGSRFNATDATKLEKGAANCSVGGNCGNRRFYYYQWFEVKLLEPSETNGKGWGLTANADLSSGDLIIEYTGEVISKAMNNNRLELHRSTRPHDTSMCSMSLGDDLYLDARNKGSLARFINHSCEPNCELQKWTVMGFTRIAVVALQGIEKGVELSFDYQFSTIEPAFFVCICGSTHCRGTLAGSAKQTKVVVQEPPRELGQAELWDGPGTDILQIASREETNGFELQTA